MIEQTPDKKKLQEEVHAELDSAIAKIDALLIAQGCADAEVEEMTLRILLSEIRASLDKVHEVSDRLDRL